MRSVLDQRTRTRVLGDTSETKHLARPPTGALSLSDHSHNINIILIKLSQATILSMIRRKLTRLAKQPKHAYYDTRTRMQTTTVHRWGNRHMWIGSHDRNRALKNRNLDTKHKIGDIG